MTEPLISPDSIVGRVMNEYPGTLAVLVRHRMHCPGCVMASFMTVAEAAASYGLDISVLIGELRVAVHAEREGAR